MHEESSIIQFPSFYPRSSQQWGQQSSRPRTAGQVDHSSGVALRAVEAVEGRARLGLHPALRHQRQRHPRRRHRTPRQRIVLSVLLSAMAAMAAASALWVGMWCWVRNEIRCSEPPQKGVSREEMTPFCGGVTISARRPPSAVSRQHGKAPHHPKTYKTRPYTLHTWRISLTSAATVNSPSTSLVRFSSPRARHGRRGRREQHCGQKQ